MRYWLAATIASVLLVAGFVFDVRGALGGYLAAYAFASSVALGALTLAMVGRLTEASWYRTAAREPTERLVATIPLLGILFAPIALGISHLYPWTWLDDARAPYLAPSFFLLRSALYLLAWGVLALLLPRAPRVTSAVGLPIVALTATFASFDWLLSLDLEFSSAAFGLYFWSGGFAAAVALVILLGVRGEALPQVLLTASIFWAYIAYSQGLIVWIAQIPRETAWYATRTEGTWRFVLGALLLAKFVVPFLVLLPYTWKRRGGVQIAAASSVLVGHALDMQWLVAPSVHGALGEPLVALAALVALASFFLGAAEREPEVAVA